MALHLESRGLRDKFKRVSDLIRPYTTLSGGVFHNVQTFRDQYMSLMEMVDELEKASPEAEVDNMRNDLVVLQNERVILETKLAGYRHVEEEVAMLKAIALYLELEKSRFLDKISMLKHGVRKLKSDLNESTLRNTYLHESVVGSEDHLYKVNENMSWVLSNGITKIVGKLIVDSSFYNGNWDLQTICVDYG